jgi:hypothetical protein
MKSTNSNPSTNVFPPFQLILCQDLIPNILKFHLPLKHSIPSASLCVIWLNYFLYLKLSKFRLGRSCVCDRYCPVHILFEAVYVTDIVPYIYCWKLCMWQILSRTYIVWSCICDRYCPVHILLEAVYVTDIVLYMYCLKLCMWQIFTYIVGSCVIDYWLSWKIVKINLVQMLF